MSTKYKPLQGLAFCCTGFDNATRIDLQNKIESLGGHNYLDLMTDVNYLIVGKRQSQKYQFCIKQRYDIKFISSNTIHTLYEKWINGDDELNIDELLLPVFSNIDACISRSQLADPQLQYLLKSVKFRQSFQELDKLNHFKEKDLIQLFIDQGGSAKESLAQKNNCIISATPKGNRYNKAVEWNIPVIHPIWILDSIIRGAALDWNDYILNENTNEKYNHGCFVWDQIIQNKQVRKKQMEQAERLDEVPKKINVKNKNNREIWSSIMENTKKQTKQLITDDKWNIDDDENDEDEVSQLTIKKDVPILENKLFIGCHFSLVGFDTRESELLSKAIVNASGKCSKNTFEKSITHIIVPTKKGASLSQCLNSLPRDIESKVTNGTIKLVTEFFIERCMFYKIIVFDKWGQPFKGLLQSSKSFKICTSGFTGIELLHIEKLIKFLNIQYCDTLTSDRDLLILNINVFKSSFMKKSPSLFKYKKTMEILNCPTYQSNNNLSVSIMSAKNKIDAAKRWNIPVVSLSYLFEIFECSINEDHAVFPEITNSHWCIFAPKSKNKPGSLMEYITKSNESNKKESSEECYTTSSLNDESGSIRLPSPRKIQSSKQKYGRIAGGSPQSVKSKLIKAAESEDESHRTRNGFEFNPDITNEEELSQVRYQDQESMINKANLLKKLSGDTTVRNSATLSSNTSSTTRKRRKR